MARQIKRYENRKLYDTAASSYVSLGAIAELVRQGETVEVMDNVTGEDITGQTLTQVILEEGKQGRSALSTDALHALLRRGSEVLDTGLEQVRSGLDELVHRSIHQLTDLAQVPSQEEMDELAIQVDRLEAQVERLTELLKRKSGLEE